MKEMEKKFGKYHVTLSVWTEDGEPRSDCLIEYGDFGASLACADDIGELENHATGRTHTIDPGTLDTIRNWAVKNGY